MAGPLAGLRVVDCSRGTAGPRLTWLLADYGADVIWVEPPGGDPWRASLAVPYSVFGRNKRSAELDLHTDSGRAGLFELLGTADVFVESWRPGVADRLGLSYDTLHAQFPELVYCSISGFGPGRPDSDVRGHEPLVAAAVGAMSATGHRDGPIYLGLPTATAGAAYMAAIGVLAALLRREEDGWGRRVETSLLDGMVAYLAQGWGYSDTVISVARMMASRFVSRTFRCADDEYLGVCTFARGAFDRLLSVLGIADRFGPDTGDATAGLTPEEAGIIYNELPEIFATQPRKVWTERLIEADIAAIPCLRQGEVFDEPQAVHNQMVVEVSDPVLGPLQQAAPAIRFAKTPVAPPRPMPGPGQHTQEVLREAAEMSRRAGRIRTGEPDGRPLLDGVRILDLGHWYAGPFSSRLLADLGADVIKLEPPSGDGMRGFERAFSAAQAGKRAIAADLKDPELAPLRDFLLNWATIVQHNLRPGVAERLGLGYEDACAVNSELLYLNAPGWGTTGPETLRQSFAPLMSGYVGAAFEIAGDHNPPMFPAANEDSGAGLLGAVSMLLALVHQKLGGAPQYLELPQLNSAITDVAHIVRRGDRTVLGANGLDTLQMGIGPLRRLYGTADGWLCIVITSDAQLRSLGETLGLALAADERFATVAAATANEYPLERLLTDAFATRPTGELLGQLRAAGIPAVEPAMNNNAPFMDDPLNARLGRVGELTHPRYGHVKEPAVMVRVSDAVVPVHRRAPELGEHTDEILTMSGYTGEQIASLRASRVVI